jgi:hypothetical protein
MTGKALAFDAANDRCKGEWQQTDCTFPARFPSFLLFVVSVPLLWMIVYVHALNDLVV